VRKRRSKDELLMKIIVHGVLITFVVMTIFPMALTLILSFTDQTSIMNKGYSLIPDAWSLDAYKYLFDAPVMMLRATKTVSLSLREERWAMWC